MKGLLNQWIDKRISDISDLKKQEMDIPEAPRTPQRAHNTTTTVFTPRGNVMARRDSAFNHFTAIPVKQKPVPNALSSSSTKNKTNMASRRMLTLDPNSPFNTNADETRLSKSRSHNKKHFVRPVSSRNPKPTPTSSTSLSHCRSKSRRRRAPRRKATAKLANGIMKESCRDKKKLKKLSLTTPSRGRQSVSSL